MAKVIIDPTEATGFLRDFQLTTDEIDTLLESIKLSFTSNCSGWRDQSRTDFDEEFQQFIGEVKHFIQDTEVDKEFLQRLITFAEAIAEVRIRRS